jgi:MYXO-CTERM domain-containing protein
MKSAKCLSKTRQQHSLLRWLVAGVGLFAAKNAFAAEYYVSPTGSDSGAGTQAAPFATLSKASSAAAAGDTIWMRGGTYNTTGQITLSKSGTSDTNRLKIWAYAGEVPIISFSNYSLASGSSDRPAITVTGSWIHLKGIEIGPAKVGSSGSHSYSLLRTSGSASNNTFELLNIHNGFGPGLFIDTGNGGNLILNCDSHDNYDVNGSQGDGQNGDGFGVHYQTSGPSTVIRGCRAWGNADDGYDLISQEVPVTVEHNWAISIGLGGGNGNGFKMGSSKTGIRHIVQNNVAWKCKASGFYANHSSGGNNWYNNTSYNNGTQYNMLASTWDSAGNRTDGVTLSGSKAHVMTNNIAFPSDQTDMNGVVSTNNTWDLVITPAASDFASVSDTGCEGPREADGSLPSACAMLKLAAGSKMIDKGKDVGLPYVGSAPDLGAYEYGAATTTGGTSGGGGGSTGAGGSSGGNTGSGGSTRSGGSTAVGGSTVIGGNTVIGGSTRSGGSTGIAGSSGNGGRTGSGGSTVVGGGVVAGGSTAAGGNTVSGGSIAAGGAPTAGTIGTTGGASGMGGSVAAETGGTTAAGGIIDTGGASQGAAGIAAAGGTSNQGGAGVGGVTGPSATGGSTAEAAAAASGCGCTLGSRSPGGGMAALLMVGALALLVRRRRNRG